ncbi:hypothetical protein DY000_02030699 [Brassica cretica]|uniref:Uncharacterized protein n=1 Tax=Brassica cretica TaxID=69181 RepID=A0ABQ7DJT8_BRACR|nr:hypothetical protein DY000_02030699 [Brassica cretica]
MFEQLDRGELGKYALLCNDPNLVPEKFSPRLLGMAKPCRNVTGTATDSHHEREAILPSEKERVELCRYESRSSFGILSKSYGCFFGTDIYRSDLQTVKFISVLPLIQKEPGNGRHIIGKISMPAFQIIYRIVKSTHVCVYDQPGDEATLVKQMVSDRTLPENHIDLISESSGVALLEPSRSIRRFFRFLQNPWQRGSETSGLAMLLVWACGAETFVPWTLLETAGVQRQTVLATLLLNFHSWSSIYSNETDEQE